MEFASGGELFDYIVYKNRLSEIEACRLFQQLISGVTYLHNINVAHRDLKPENLLLDHKKDLKIADFGLSNVYRSDDLLNTACGSPCYAAPEMVMGQPYQGLKADIWSTGIILFAMLCGYLPFEDKNNQNLFKKIIEGKLNIPKYLSEQAKDLLKNLISVDPKTRYNIEQINKHPWFNMITPNLSKGLIISLYEIPVNDYLSMLLNLKKLFFKS